MAIAPKLRAAPINWNTRVAIGLVVFLMVVVAVLGMYASKAAKDPGPTRELFVMVVGGLVVLIATLAVLAAIFNLLELTDRTQAMALPEGSIRAVISLALLVLFAILSVFLYGTFREGGGGTLENLTFEQANEFRTSHTNLPNLSMKIARDSTGKEILAPTPPGAPSSGPNPGKSSADKGAPPAGNQGGATTPGVAAQPTPAAYLYVITYGNAPGADDFAKQLMTLMGTLVTSVVSFYFGAKTATSAAAASAGQNMQLAKEAKGEKAAMTLTRIDPVSFALSAGNKALLTILGNNLNPVIHARLERKNHNPIDLEDVNSNPTQVTGTVAVTEDMKDGAWDIVVDNGDGESVRLPGALTIGDPPIPPPTINGVVPATLPSAPEGAQDLQINGANLNVVTAVRLQRASSPGTIPLTGVTSSDAMVKATIEVTAAMAGDAWDVVVTDANGKDTVKMGAITIG